MDAINHWIQRLELNITQNLQSIRLNEWIHQCNFVEIQFQFAPVYIYNIGNIASVSSMSAFFFTFSVTKSGWMIHSVIQLRIMHSHTRNIIGEHSSLHCIFHFLTISYAQPLEQSTMHASNMLARNITLKKKSWHWLSIELHVFYVQNRVVLRLVRVHVERLKAQQPAFVPNRGNVPNTSAFKIFLHIHAVKAYNNE